MRIDIEGDDLIRAAGDPAAKRIIRSAAYFLLAAIGDIPDETEVHTATGAALDAKLGVVPTGTNEDHRPGAMPSPFSAPSIAPAATATAANGAVASGAGTSTTSPVPPPPTVRRLRLTFPPPPPPAVERDNEEYYADERGHQHGKRTPAAPERECGYCGATERHPVFGGHFAGCEHCGGCSRCCVCRS
jgi:hypothetical protein